MQFVRPCGHKMKDDARIAPREPIDDCRYETGRTGQCVPNPHLPSRRVGEKLDVLHALTQLIEYSDSTIEQSTTVLSRLDTLALAIEQAHADGMLQLGDRSRNRGLDGIQAFCRFSHAASL